MTSAVVFLSKPESFFRAQFSLPAASYIPNITVTDTPEQQSLFK